VEAGADAIIIETQTALEELEIGIRAAKEAGAPAIIGSLAFDRMLNEPDVRTMMGISPERAAGFLLEAGADVAALNCGAGVDMPMAAGIVKRYRATADLPTMAQPNAGQPVLLHGRIHYDETPEQMAEGVRGLIEAGARVIGGCCGSTPAHIRAMRHALQSL
jgi:5-methyltetrahydrofolate--homocysteine methyltransferase